MRNRLLTLGLTLIAVSCLTIDAGAAPPPWAKNVKTDVTKTADSEEVVVEVDGVKAGRRQDKTGLYDLVWERDPTTLGFGHRLHPHKITKVFPNEREPIPAPHETGPVRDVPTASPDNPVVIDVNIYYSANAGVRVPGGESGMPAFAQLTCALANQTYANSGLPYITFRCFGPFKVSYVEGANDALAWMSRLPTATTTGGQPEIQQRFMETGADLGHLVTNDGACGLGYLTSGLSTSISQSEWDCTNSNLSGPHEMGHNIGFHHDPATVGCTTISPTSGLPFCSGSFNYGHAWPIGAVQWRTIMAYPGAGGTRITQISNPNILYQGQWPTGIANERDNARVAVGRAPVVAAFRTAVLPSTTLINHLR